MDTPDNALTAPGDALLSIKQLRQLEGNISKQTVYRRIASGSYPKPVKYHGQNYWFCSWYRDHIARLKSEAAA